MFHLVRCGRLAHGLDQLLRLRCTNLKNLSLHHSRCGHAPQWPNAPAKPSKISSFKQMWAQTQKVLKAARRRGPNSPKVALTFLGVPAALSITARLFSTVAHCHVDVNNNLPAEVHAKEKVPEFSWGVLWEFVRPQLLALVGAIILAFGAAALNIQIPLMLGDLVNVVAQHLREHAGNYMRDIQEPALKLLCLYGLQGLLTCGYIILLSRVGERVAANMRKTLFMSLMSHLTQDSNSALWHSSQSTHLAFLSDLRYCSVSSFGGSGLMMFPFHREYTLDGSCENILFFLLASISLFRQEVAFFDANKTGQLVNRLTADIQEFKSSFKLVVSQGLRSITQTVGCFVSLYIISPKLTGLMVVMLPCLVGAGALIGSFLRRLSRKAQEQVSKATGVADEALGNVRTVRAFAMEDRELEWVFFIISLIHIAFTSVTCSPVKVTYSTVTAVATCIRRLNF
ncbi:hypothetical protein P4O66_010037 [Electrophorus voltai]|uniref:ABC transmembrane type-1 domain-containing protein n=1 Tax=Electrophorus voltai TaxID=2609070 RepID=A0AAD9DVZ8_9TELE|nr:hypothetical protein P4O66_010037 [Electrophorus voltai]